MSGLIKPICTFITHHFSSAFCPSSPIADFKCSFTIEVNIKQV